MAALCRVPVLLLFFLLAARHSFAVDQNRLAPMVNNMLTQYGVKGMFSLALSIPQNQNQDLNQNLQEVFNSDPGQNVKNTILTGVYVGRRVVAAQVSKPHHAESLVVDKLDKLSHKGRGGDLLLFYVYASPCAEKCTNANHRGNILCRIEAMKQWKSYAFVFSKVFKPRNAAGCSEAERAAALQRLGRHIGLHNVFRCDKRDNKMQCVCCSSGGRVNDYCVSDGGGGGGGGGE